jgi:hypothetical protein
MGGDDSQKLLPWRGIGLLSGAQQTSGSQQNHTVTENGRAALRGPSLQPGVRSAIDNLGHFWKAGVGHYSKAPKRK